MTTTLIDRLLGKKGPAVLTDAERVALHEAFSDIARSNLRLTRMVNSAAEALRWNGLTVVHQARDGGSVGYDLANAPNTENVTGRGHKGVALDDTLPSTPVN